MDCQCVRRVKIVYKCECEIVDAIAGRGSYDDGVDDDDGDARLIAVARIG